MFVLMFFIEPSTSNAQFADSLEVPDSLFYMMIDQDSIWTIQAQDSISNFGVYSKNNIESCAKTISYVPTKDEILYNQKDRYILFYSDDFNDYNTSFWKDIDNCSDECWGDPNTRCEADEDQKVQYYKRANVTIDEDNVETYHSSQKESNEVEFSVYPNPADKEFTLVISADSFIGKVEVYNILGLEVQQYNFNAFSSGINTVNSELWPDGIYFIVLSSASGQRLQEKKLVICQRDQ